MPTITQPTAAAGVISCHELYRLPELQKRLGLGKHAIRQARRAGLKIRRVGTRSYVLGKDVLDWIEGQPLVKG